ncbi:hypothetical protein EPK99_11985 [Neorhizobium lilium]|uniref:DUF2188 domain-containing protein n=1 Tax=Neorhizobium lilium TaxID=2503024 RepID=A0A444LJT5_9HYPH|nr:hypothetical protein [Neorhizobium lilium]RWX79268.1 hypothetical protein EPK99_11985 [Neorhizobium lilium]
MQKYCDIMPDATGWVYVIDGVRSASYHHTYELALEAAKSQFVRKGRFAERLFRLQAPNGEMLPISRSPTVAGAAPRLSAHA